MSKKPACVIVVYPLKVLCKIRYSKLLRWASAAISPSDASLEDVESGKYQQISSFAEEILDKSFLDRLKNGSTPLHQNLIGLIDDKVHMLRYRQVKGLLFLFFFTFLIILRTRYWPNSKEFCTRERLFLLESL